MFTRLRSILGLVFVITALVSQSFQPVRASSLAQEQGPRIGYNSVTGRLSFIGADPARPIVVREAQAPGLSPADRGLAMIAPYAGQFGLRSPRQELTLKSSRQDNGRRMTRYQQVYRGIPVLAGELIVNAGDRGELLSISGEIAPDLNLDTAPAITAEQAQQAALQTIAKGYNASPDGFRASQPELWIYDPRLLGTGEGPALLTWRMDVTSADSLAPVRELVLVDAQRGSVALHFNQIDTAWPASRASLPAAHAESRVDHLKALTPGSGGSLLTYTAGNGTTLPGTLLCDETVVECTFGATPHADAAHFYADGTWAFYNTKHGRDSIDDAGMTLISTVHFDTGYQNASWNGTQMIYGDAYGYPLADDVVAHELTHGVTRYESNLFYYYQSGAINESFSDVWGELYDQANGQGDDTAGVKWLVGEDISGLGAGRSMSNPLLYGHPDAVTSMNYYYGPLDNGGVHINSGINNKAAFLMVDGGTHNSITVSGIGADKTLAVYYEVQTNLLTSGADYADLYNALYQACLSLVGGSEGITSGDCTEVRDATDAVRMNLQPSGDPNFNLDAPVCSGTDSPVTTFYDDLESGAGSWTFGLNTGTQRWQSGSPYGNFAHSGTGFLYADDLPAAFADVFARTTNPILVPSAGFLRFDHAYDFEQFTGVGTTYFDGGVLEYSTNGGSTWVDAGSLILNNGYDGTLSNAFGNPLANRSAFAGPSHGYISTRVNLASLAGQNVMFRWRMGLDNSGAVWGWWLDDVHIYTCEVASTGNTDVYIGPPRKGSFDVLSNQLSINTYASMLDGPVRVINNNTDDTLTSQRVTSGASYNELMGVPPTQFTTEYWFPFYDHGYSSVPGNAMRTWVLVGNPHDTLTAEVDIYIGGVLKGSYSIPPGSRVTPRWTGLVDGPVRVISTNGVNIFASERVFTVPNNSFNETFGFPADQFTTEYWFPWYDSVNMNASILVGNTSSSQSANVDIYIGPNFMGSYSIAANDTLIQSYPSTIDGPVRVVATNGIDIVASEAALSGPVGNFTAYNEVMGYPFDQFATEYWFPYYDHGYPGVGGSNMRTWVLVGNPDGTLTADVDIYIAGVLQGSYSIPPNSRVTPRWVGLQSGPVQVVSDIPVFTSERVFTSPSNVFNEMMGYPATQLTDEYWFPWYDSINMTASLIIARP